MSRHSAKGRPGAGTGKDVKDVRALLVVGIGWKSVRPARQPLAFGATLELLRPCPMHLEVILPPNIGVDANKIGRSRKPTHMWHYLIAVPRGTARVLQPEVAFGWSGLSCLFEVCPASGKGAREKCWIWWWESRESWAPSELAASTSGLRDPGGRTSMEFCAGAFAASPPAPNGL